MWSGSMSSQGEPFSSQVVGSWALNPSMPYMNVPHEQVDWASLAQQWIKMKEEVPEFDKEGGEAPMDIIKEENSSATPPNPSEWPATTSDGGSTWSGSWSWNQAGGVWCWNPVGQHVTKPTGPSTFTPSYPTIPDVSTPIIPQPTAFPYTPPQAPNSNDSFPQNHTYWAGTTSENKDSTWESQRTHKKHNTTEHPSDIDPAKRKQLPAWIREGLEKMEREKLKKAEQERLEKLRKDELARQTELNFIDTNGLAVEDLPTKSKFDTESDDSDHEAEVPEIKSKIEEKPRKSRFDWHNVAIPPPPQIKYRSKEQILQSVMVDVRKILTQVLMEVTTEEIQKAVDEEIRHFNRKAPATTVRKTAALTSLTGKLGLGIYESDSDSESEPEEKVNNDPDSDQELRDRIEKLKNEFVSVEKAIEIEAAEQEERERKQLKNESVNKEEITTNHEEQVQPFQEDSPESSDKIRLEEHNKEISDTKRTSRLSESSNKSENLKEININNTNTNVNNKSSKKLVSSERSYRRSSSSYSSSVESSSSSSSSSRSSSSRYKRRRRSRKRSGGDRRSSRYSRSRTRSRSRSASRSRRDRTRHGSECRRRARRRVSRDRKGRSRRSSSTSSNGHHRSRKSSRRR